MTSNQENQSIRIITDNSPKLWRYLSIIIIAFLIFLNFQQCSEKKELQVQRSNTVLFLEDSLETYRNKLGQEIATKASLAGDKNQLEILLSKQVDSTNELKALVKKYKNVRAAGIINSDIKIDTVYVPFEIKVPNEFFRTINIQKEFYSLTGEVDQDGIMLYDLSLPNKTSFVLGDKKNGWFKKPTYQIDVKQSNPYIKTTGIDSYSFSPKVPKWSLGPYLGYDFFQAQPSLGISLQWSVFRF